MAARLINHSQNGTATSENGQPPPSSATFWVPYNSALGVRYLESENRNLCVITASSTFHRPSKLGAVGQRFAILPPNSCTTRSNLPGCSVASSNPCREMFSGCQREGEQSCQDGRVVKGAKLLALYNILGYTWSESVIYPPLCIHACEWSGMTTFKYFAHYIYWNIAHLDCA